MFQNSCVLFLLFASINAKLKNECASKLLDGCDCSQAYYQRENKYVVNCTDLRFTNVEMLKVLPEETEALIFTGNNISSLPWNIFGELNNLTNLKSIDMSNNGIKEIKGKAYHHVPNVEILILNHNELIISSNENADDLENNYHHPRVFSNFINLQELHLTNAFADNTELATDLHDIFVNSALTKLYKLHLEQNEIRNFKDADVFCNLDSLRDLYLGDNYITSLNFNLKCLKKLKFLDLEHNGIVKFTQKDLDNLDQMVAPYRDSSFMIDIGRNPLKCENGVKVLYPWMQKTNVTIRNKETLQCHSNKFGAKYFLHLKSLFEQKQSRFSQGTTVLLIVLSIILVCLVAAYGYLSRESLKKNLAPIIDKVGRKVQYTTIESQDV